MVIGMEKSLSHAYKLLIKTENENMTPFGTIRMRSDSR